jgi:hypothetical protein
MPTGQHFWCSLPCSRLRRKAAALNVIVGLTSGCANRSALLVFASLLPEHRLMGDKIWQRVSKGVSYGIPGGPELTIFILKKVIQITVFIDL